MGRRASGRNRRHGRTAGQDETGRSTRHRRCQQRNGRLHRCPRGFARGGREAVRKPSSLYDLSRRCRGDHAHSADPRRLTGASASSSQRRNTMPYTVRLHRVIATKPEKVYRAFLEADALAKWLPPNGFTCTVHQLEPKVGGKYKMSFRNFTTGQSHSFGGEYVELSPNERLRYTDKFDDPNLPGQIQVTISL